MVRRTGYQAMGEDGAVLADFEAGNSLRCNRLLRGEGAASSLATAGNRTITAAEVMSGIYVRDPAGAARTDTLPTAALLVAAMKALRPEGAGLQVGDILECMVINGADAAETLTIAAGAGGAFDANQTAASRVVPQNHSKVMRIRFTAIAAGAEAYVVYL